MMRRGWRNRVPIYSISSLISLYSLDLAFFLDAFRDVYEVRVYTSLDFRSRTDWTSRSPARPSSSSELRPAKTGIHTIELTRFDAVASSLSSSSTCTSLFPRCPKPRREKKVLTTLSDDVKRRRTLPDHHPSRSRSRPAPFSRQLVPLADGRKRPVHLPRPQTRSFACVPPFRPRFHPEGSI